MRSSYQGGYFLMIRSSFLFCLLSFSFLQFATADTVTDTSLGVSYTATSNFVAGPGNIYDVFLTVDPTAFSAGSGFLTALSMQFKTGSDVSTSVTLLSAPGGVADWGLETPGGLNSSGCNGNGANSGDVCFQDISANTVVPGGPYNFEFAVTMPGTDALTAASDIKAAYNVKMDNSGKNLGLTSMGITIQTSIVPEPSARWYMLIAGVLALLVASKRKSSLAVRASH
jgi:hypothetical protein